MEKKYYIEILNKGYDLDPPYLIQTKTFDTPEDAENWYHSCIEYIDLYILKVDLMLMNYTNEYEYEVEFIKHLN